MASHVVCLTRSGGIPLFTRQKGDGDTATFSEMASLNGIRMFLESRNLELLSTDLPDRTVVWKEFEGCIVLIVIASGATKYVLDRFLDAVFGAMVLFVGIDEIKNAKNVDRLKRDVRSCTPIVDRLLECLDTGDKTCGSSGGKTDIPYMTECSISQDNHLLRTCLEGYTECLDSTYGCMLVHGSLAVATESWWSLDSIERKLLITAVTTESMNCTVHDLPVFLPRKSPSVAYRLVSVTLIDRVQVLTLCGPTPELSEIERYAIQCWKSSIDILRTYEQNYPRNLPPTILLDDTILGFLLVDQDVEKFLFGRNAKSGSNRLTGTHRSDILRTFYHQAVETFILLSNEIKTEPNEDKGRRQSNENNTKFTGNVKETYLCSEFHKCHAVKDGTQILCVLYTSVTPTHTMRLISRKLLKLLLADKQICW